MNRIVVTSSSTNRLAHLSFAVLVALLFCFWPGGSALQAQTTSFIYQGRLTDAGNPANGNYDLQFKLFDTVTVGTGVQQAATLVRNPVGASAGVFTVTLDFGANVFDGSARYVEIGVRPAGSMTAYMVLVPRQPVTATPYAIKSLNAAAADGLSAVCVGCVTGVQIGSLPTTDGNYIQNTTTPQAGASFNISGNGLVGGSVGIGTTTPASRLHLVNADNFTGGLLVEASQGDRAAIYYAPELGMVLDSFRPTDLRRLPLLFQPFGGNVSIGSAFPKHHLSILGGPAWTINQWAGAVDLSNASAIGWGANVGGKRFGIGQSTGGLYFFHTLSDPGTTGNPAIYDMQIDDNGDVHVTGTLSKGGGAFQIDHPLDPANKYLYHSFVESPDMMNIYNGNVTTDSDGDATITLPDYFEALNRDVRYQLTVIGQFAQAMVSSEVRNNRFSIKTDKPQIKVSWQVTGIRQDAYANANRIKVEEDKPETERGHYLHPRAFERRQ